MVIATIDEHITCCDGHIANLTHDDLSCAIDSGASCHVKSRRDFFTSYTSGYFGDVKMVTYQKLLALDMYVSVWHVHEVIFPWCEARSRHEYEFNFHWSPKWWRVCQ